MSRSSNGDEMPAAVRQMRFWLLVIGLQFIVPAVGYIVDPGSTVAVIEKLNALLGGAPSWSEAGYLWHMLAVGNVMTLGFLCIFIRSDVKRFLPALPGLVFLKGFSSLYSLFIAAGDGVPVFFLVFALDGVTAVAMAVLSLRAAHALALDTTSPWWARWLLVDPELVEQRLRRIDDPPTLGQITAGAVRMWHRILFRSETVGMSSLPVRRTWRARLLSPRALRLPVLLWERAVFPLDPTGLLASRARLVHHVVAAHHDGMQLLYDLELLRLHDDGLTVLRRELASVVDGTHPRAAWLRDLCVFERYHEEALAAVDAALAGVPVDRALAADADATFSGFLAWCRAQPPRLSASSLFSSLRPLAPSPA